jgi:ATP-binding cassette subfamily B multidrug efflux pump
MSGGPGTDRQRPPAPDASRYPVTLGGQLRDKMPYYVAGAVLLLALQALLAQRDFLVRDAVDAAVDLRATDVKVAALWIVGVSVSAAAIRVLSRIAVFTAGRNVEYELRALLLDRLQRLGPAFFRRVPTGDIMSRATNDLAQVRLLLGFGVLNIVGSSFALVSAFYVMFSSSWKLSLAAMINLPILAVVTRTFSSRMFTRVRDNQEAIGKMSDRVLSSLAGVRVVRAFGLVPSERHRFETANVDYLDKSLSLARLRGSMAPVMGALGAVGVLTTFWYGGVLLERKEISPGDFVAFWLALVRLTWPLIAIGFVASIIQRGRAGYERLRTVFDAVPEIASGELRRAEPVRGALRVEKLSFHHGDRAVLDQVSFEVPAGSSVAIVGRTGSGKSTLASLLPRLLPTPPGAVFLDGDDVCDLPLERVRGSIGYAQQDAFLFSTTVARNIGYALDDPDSDAAHERILDAATEASVREEVERLPEAFDTVVGERGVQLSGGQRQRVALARALLRNAPVLVLDDPLSAVDARTEAAILRAIDRQRELRTVVLVTHRIAAARRCDAIVVLDEGRVVERGTHDELVAHGGIYAAFAEEQALEAELARLGSEAIGEPAPVGAATAPADGPTERGGKRRGDEVMARFHEEGAVQTYDAKHLRQLWPYLRPERAKIALSLVLLVVASGLALGRPLVMRDGLDAALAPGGMDMVLRAGIALTALIVLEQAIAFPQMYLMQIAGARGMANLRRAVFAFLHTRALSFFDRQPVGRLVTRVTNDVDAIGEMFSSGALNAFGDLLRLALIVAVMLSLDWQMSLLAFAALPPVMAFVNWTRRRMRDAFREIRVKTARMNAYLNEQVSGMGIVQAYAHEEQAAAEFDAINQAYRQANNRSIVYDASLDAAIDMIASLCIASVLWFAGLHAEGERVSFGTLFAFIAYIEMFFVPIRDLSTRYTLVQSAMTGAERVFELLGNTDEDAPSRPGEKGEASAAVDDGSPAIELEDVTFGYKPGVPVLHEVSLTAKRGERIALVGATGAGKSTVASLVLRLYEHQSGQVRVEGRDVSAWDPDALRARFAVVPQEVFLFPGTVAGNIAAGDEEPDRQRVKDALATVGALDLFERREGGLDAKVAERGSNFSAGERQLIAFARALYRDPPMLILDEATANVDSDTEARLQRAVERVMRGRTCLVIAHRLSTIKAADRIVVFHRGRVAEQGTHEELLARGGVYAKLHELQFAKERAGIAAE